MRKLIIFSLMLALVTVAASMHRLRLSETLQDQPRHAERCAAMDPDCDPASAHAVC